ncbi:MAG: LiaF-related protein [Syntrophomonadaceae bacterium]|nr:LiaF-related protein [Syntrophomonadaceae bacterium]
MWVIAGKESIHIHRISGRYFIGILIIVIGIIALLNNFGLVNISFSYLVSLLWPLLLGIAGINFIVNRRDIPGIVTGSLLIALGVMFLGRNAGFFDINMQKFWQGFWPIIIILIGVSLLSKNKSNSSGHLAIMGAVEKNNAGWELESADYLALMGGIELDIRQATFREREINLGLSAIMGGITVIVPEDVAVTCKGTAAMGGIDLLGRESGGIVGSATMQSGDLQSADKILNLNCLSILGGIEIKR